jgi:two-component system aerobic respiration control sensor histidine kinase ArcB
VSSSRERVHEVFADSGRDFDAKVREALEYGTDYLGLSVGFRTQIADGTQEFVQVVGGSSTAVASASCPLDDAYCLRTIQSDSPLAVEDAECSPAVDESAYDRFGLGAYVGTTVLVDGEVYGTVCFADHEPREPGFDEEERVFVELLSTLVGYELERRRFERELQQQNARLEREKSRFQGITETSFDIISRSTSPRRSRTSRPRSSACSATSRPHLRASRSRTSSRRRPPNAPPGPTRTSSTASP